MAASSLARFRLPWKLNRHVCFWILSTRMVPPIVVIVPLFLLFRSVGLVNTYWLPEEEEKKRVRRTAEMLEIDHLLDRSPR